MRIAMSVHLPRVVGIPSLVTVRRRDVEYLPARIQKVRTAFSKVLPNLRRTDFWLLLEVAERSRAMCIL